MKSSRKAADANRTEKSGGLVSAVFGFASGAPMGRVQTDATFWHHGRNVVEDRRGRFCLGPRVSWWAFVPDRTRFVVRWSVALFVVAWVIWPDWMALPASIAAGAVMGSMVGFAVRGVRTARWRRRVVEPLRASLASVLGEPPLVVMVPLNWTVPGARTWVTLPHGFARNEGISRNVARVFADKLGIPASELVVSWDMEGETPRVSCSKRAPIPASVVARNPEVQRLMDSLSDGEVLLGLSRGGRPDVADLDSDSPHMMMGAGSGGGKSITVSGVSAQLMKKGARVEILDTKVSSHPWAHAVPSIKYSDTTAEIHDALVAAGVEMQARNDSMRGRTTVPDFQRVVLVIEEVNTLVGRLKRYWAETRTKDDPKDSPAITALVEIANMGRAVRCHLIFVGQRLSVQGIGGTPEAGAQIRTSCGVRIVARHDAAMWGMVMERRSAPPASGHAGRAYTLVGGVLRQTQLVFWEGLDAANWAMGRPMSGDEVEAPDEWPEAESVEGCDDDETQPVEVRETAPVPVAEVTSKALVLVQDDDKKFHQNVPSHPVGTDDVTLPQAQDSGESGEGDAGDGDTVGFVSVTLREWVSSRGFGASTAKGLEVVKTARKRDPSFPKAVATDDVTKAAQFDAEALDEWARNRSRGTRLGEAS